MITTSIDSLQVTAWLRNEFLFNDLTLFEATQMLSSWYGIEFIYIVDQRRTLRLQGGLSRATRLDDVLRYLNHCTEAHFESHGDKIIIR